MPRSLSRRRFLQQSAAATSFYLALPYARGDDNKTSPNGRLNLGVIGLSNRAGEDLKGVKSENIVAICDVDENNAEKAREEFPKAQYFQDFRKLMDLKNLDAIVVGTPDHMHAIPTLAALRSGRHVYCEKPLAHTVHEVRVVRDTAAKTGLVTQMGTQIHADDNYRRVVELVEAGTIGKIERVHVWCNVKPRPATKNSHISPKEQAAGFNYDLWLGPAAPRPYNPDHLQFVWRWWWDFGGGVLADMACHYMDLPHWALNLREPVRVVAQGKENGYQVPSLMQVDYQYPARGGLPPVHLTWYHGVGGPDLSGTTTYPGYGSGVLFEGEKGKLLADYSKHKLLPEEKFKDFVPPPKTIAKSKGHHLEWIDAIKNKGKTTCNFDYSGAFAETVLLGNVAYRAGEEVNFDPATATIPSSPKASAFLDKEYRKGWSL